MPDFSERDGTPSFTRFQMMNMNMDDVKRRLKEIENRKIEILMETGKINAKYNETMEQLNSEYEELDEECYRLRMRSIRGKNRIS
jgi:predicted transcriptional regulator